MTEHRYEVEVVWNGATTDYRSYSRNHEIRATGQPSIPCSADPKFRGAEGHWDPEQMFVASLSQCHMLWYLHLCAEAGVIVTYYHDLAAGTMNDERFTEVTLRPQITVTEPAMTSTARHLHTEAHRRCFLANSVNFPVRHEPTVSADQPGLDGAQH
ncbi:MAG: OsmC family protein [Mycobacterium sp.]